MAPSRQGSVVRGRGKEAGAGQNAGEKRPTRRREKARRAGARLGDARSRIRFQNGLATRAARGLLPSRGPHRRRLPRATRTAAAHGRGCTPHWATLLELETQTSPGPGATLNPESQAQGSGRASEGQAERTHCARDPSAPPFKSPGFDFLVESWLSGFYSMCVTRGRVPGRVARTPPPRTRLTLLRGERQLPGM